MDVNFHLVINRYELQMKLSDGARCEVLEGWRSLCALLAPHVGRCRSLVLLNNAQEPLHQIPELSRMMNKVWLFVQQGKISRTSGQKEYCLAYRRVRASLPCPPPLVF